MTDRAIPLAKIELAYVKSYKDRHGRLRHYYRRSGFASVTLPGAPGSVEFMATYAEAEARTPRPAPDPARRVQPHSINALIIEYYRSREFLDLKATTQANYRNILDRFRTRYGDRGAASIQTVHFDAIFHSMAATPGAAVNLRRRLSRVFRLAVRLGWRPNNPVRDSEAKRKKTGGFIPWTEDEIARFETHWKSGTRERLALALLLYTAVRRSDVVTMGRQHLSHDTRGNDRISVVQAKGGKRIRIPIHPKLKAELPTSGLTFLQTQYGRAFTPAGFTQWFVERAALAGVPGRTPHGLRKAAGRRLAEAGCTTKEIAAILGHSTLTEAETYTRDADQSLLADKGMSKLVETEKGTATV